MTLDFERINRHWAVAAIGDDDLKHVSDLIHQRIAKSAVGGQIEFSFQKKDDAALLDRVALACELAAVDGLDELSRPGGKNDALRDQATISSSCAFDIRHTFSAPDEILERLFFVLKLSSLAYCGDRWSDLRRWYNEHKDALAPPSAANVSWDRRLLYRLFDCWVRLFRKDGWDDLDRIREIIAGLRDDQKTMEGHRLQNGSAVLDRIMALRLAALYHWARATEVVARYMLQGQPSDPFGQLDKHFEAGIRAAAASGDAQHEIILRWLHATSRIMVSNSLWWATRSINSKTSEFVRSLTGRMHKPMFELLPPQRAALLEQNLLDPTTTAIVVDLPTSGGKTLLAQFRILQALNQFDADNGWIAYVAPTRALSAQITRRLRRDFKPMGIRVEQLTGAVEVDAFEDLILNESGKPFQILVATPEKLSLVIRNQKVERPLALVVMDEAHNMEDDARGLRIELLLSIIKRDCPSASFLLLMPNVEKPDTVSRWLAQDVKAGRVISIGTSPWKPNERIMGLYRAVKDDSKRAGWHMEYETLTATPKAMPLHGTHRVGGVRPINVPKSSVIDSEGKQAGLGLQTAAMGTVMSKRGTSIVVANRISTVWRMAKKSAQSLDVLDPIPDDIKLVQDFLRTEISNNFQLVDALSHGVGVHHAGLSDEARALIEWLAELGMLRVLCATSTIAQGINFPVSSVFLQSRFVFHDGASVEISPRNFWNLAGRAGRINHDSVGVVGLAGGNDPAALVKFTSRNTGMLVSRLVTLLDEISHQGSLNELSAIISQDEWEDFRCYVAHLWAEKKSLDKVLADSERLLRQTYGYTALRNDPKTHEQAAALLAATKSYAQELSQMRPGTAELADSTGFSPEGIKAAIRGLKGLEQEMTISDWMPDSLFGDDTNMAALFGVMLKIPQLKEQLKGIGGEGLKHTKISGVTRDWINGAGIDEIATKHFDQEDDTEALTSACLAIYRAIINSGTWGISALSRMPGMIDYDELSEIELRRINSLPAMIYHGVRSEDAILMRMNSAPRSAAEALGRRYRDHTNGDEARYSVRKAREFLMDLNSDEWDRVRPPNATLSGAGYERVWKILSGLE